MAAEGRDRQAEPGQARLDVELPVLLDLGVVEDDVGQPLDGDLVLAEKDVLLGVDVPEGRKLGPR